jgi:hypothetical protein
MAKPNMVCMFLTLAVAALVVISGKLLYIYLQTTTNQKVTLCLFDRYPCLFLKNQRVCVLLKWK